MAHITTGVEYGLHCLLWLVESRERPLSSKDLAELQGISPSFVAKIFPKLEKAGLVVANEGVKGGYTLAHAPNEISFLQVIDAIEGYKPLFDCKEIRANIALLADTDEKPEWAINGVCEIHAVMLKAEKAMRAELENSSLASISANVRQKIPKQFQDDIQAWITQRLGSKKGGRRAKP